MNTNNKQKAASRSFTIERAFAVPLHRVWDAWSRKAQFSKWWGPKGCSLDVLLLDFRAGGFTHYAMLSPGAPTLWGRFSYREITPRERIVWLNAFSNGRCGIARAPFSELCPLEIENSVRFEERDGTTTLTLHAEPFGATDEEVDYFAELCSSGSLEQGYGGTFDRLAGHLRQSAAAVEAGPVGPFLKP